MTNYFICCEQCFEDICRINTNAVRTWMDLCADKARGSDVIRLYVDESREIADLERLGFLISTEEKRGLMLKVKGHIKTSDGEDFFCAREGCHV